MEIRQVSVEEEKVKIEKPKRKNLWKPGQSGNPKGRPKGTKNKLTIIREKIEGDIADSAQDIFKLAMDMAKAGDSMMMKEIMDRVVPKNRKKESNNSGKVTINLNNLTKEETDILPHGVVIEHNGGDDSEEAI